MNRMKNHATHGSFARASAGLNRRGLLVGAAGGLCTLGGVASGNSTRVRTAGGGGHAGDEDAPVLVLIELIGGNDGLSTLVPWSDDRYHALRPKLRVPGDRVLKLDDRLGFHPRLPGLRDVFERGELAVVRGIGYPDPVYSHFKSFEIWHTANPAGRAAGDGWVARLRAVAWGEDPRPELVVHIGQNQPYSLYSPNQGVLSFESPEKFLWAGDGSARAAFQAASEAEPAPPPEGVPRRRDAVMSRLYRTLRHSGRTSARVIAAAQAYRPQVEYPAGPFGDSLRTIAALIEARAGARVLSCNLGDFDTHANQVRRHEALLRELDHGLTVLRADLAGRSSEANVVVAVVSEFGRRVAENHSGGTDHGAAGLAFLMGARVEGGLFGEQPDLGALDRDGNLVHTVDFRSLFATLVEGWFHVPAQSVLGEGHEPLPLLRS